MTARKPHPSEAMMRQIKTGPLIRRLHKHALGTEKMAVTELRAAQTLLALATAKPVEGKGGATKRPTHEELLDRLDNAARG